MRLSLPKISLLVSLSLGLVACGNEGLNGHFQSIKPNSTQAKNTTGQTKEVVSPVDNQPTTVEYTTSGNQEAFEVLQKKRKDRVESHEDISFAESIDNVDVSVQKGSNSKHQRFQATVKTDDQKSLFFDFELNTDELKDNKKFFTNAGTVEKAEKKEDSNYQVNLTCHNENCDTRFINLQKISSEGEVIAQADILESTKKSKVIAQLPEGIKNEKNKELSKKLNKETTVAKKKNVIIAGEGGKSITEVKVTDEETKEEILNITTDLVKTSETPIKVENIKVNGEIVDSSQTQLAGNNSDDGSIAVDIESEELTARVYIIDEELKDEQKLLNQLINEPLDIVGTQTSLAEPQYFKNYKDPVIDIAYQDQDKGDLPVTYEITKKLEKYRENPTVQKYIRLWQGKEKFKLSGGKQIVRKRLQSFIDLAPSFAQPLTKSFNMMDAPPQFIYLILMESNFFCNNDSKACEKEQFYSKIRTYGNNPTHTASGPFQMTNATANDVANQFTDIKNIFNYAFPQLGIGKDNQLDKKDARGYFFTSAIMAGAYAKYIYLNHFKEPSLIPLFYNKGPNLLKFIERHKKYAVNLPIVAKYDMTSRKDTKAIRYFNEHQISGVEYAYLVLAAQFIGSNPSLYGFEAQPEEVDLNTIEDLVPSNFDKSLIGL